MPPERRLSYEEARIFALFVENGPHTCGMVAEESGIGESEVLAALEKLEDMDLLVRARSSPDRPVWKLYGGPS